ncbi:hypothetical protein [Streptomyces sp. SBT349]|uniref:hypothetical protein n=1 Tax=Streptomyces sp. SBT349 TaxID=1580539 RepID=UPI00069ECBED|nr:hypothetical protein [Streptomyces sp. SBT349]
MDPAIGQSARQLPPDCEAFLALHRPRYLSYARLHLPDTAADEAVGAVFEQLFTRWRHVLSHPDPAAYAWSLFATRVRARRPPRPWQALSHAEYDAFALHHLLGYPLPDVAAAMGAEPEAVHSLLRSATVATALRRAGPVPDPRPGG